MSGSKEKTRKGNLLHTTAVVVNYASHLVSSATVDMTTRKCSLLSCHLVSFVTAYTRPALVASVSAPHSGARSDSLRSSDRTYDSFLSHVAQASFCLDDFGGNVVR